MRNITGAILLTLIAIMSLAGCYTQEEKENTWRGKEAVDSLKSESPDDPRVKQLDSSIRASLYRVGIPNPVPPKIEWNLPGQIAILKTTAAKLPDSAAKTKLEMQIEIMKIKHLAQTSELEMKNAQAIRDAQQDAFEKGIKEAKGTIKTIGDTAKDAGIPWIPAVATGAAGVLGTLGLAWKKLKSARNEISRDVVNVVELLPEETRQAVKAAFKTIANPHINNVVKERR